MLSTCSCYNMVRLCLGLQGVWGLAQATVSPARGQGVGDLQQRADSPCCAPCPDATSRQHHFLAGVYVFFRNSPPHEQPAHVLSDTFLCVQKTLGVTRVHLRFIHVRLFSWHRFTARHIPSYAECCIYDVFCS